jgi:AcrR family transcriptional regulator
MTARKESYHHGNLHEALVQSSLALIRESGPAGFTLREVARRAGVSHTAPYRHFRDKDDLLAAVAEDGFRRLRAAMEKATAAESDPVARLERCGVAYVEFAVRHPEHFQAMFSRTWETEAHPKAHAAAEHSFRLLLELVRATNPAADALAQARMAWSMVHGISTLGITRQLRYGRAELLRFASAGMTVLSRGFRA